MHYVIKKNSIRKKNMKENSIENSNNYVRHSKLPRHYFFIIFYTFYLLRSFRRIDKISHRILLVTKDNSGNCLSRKITNSAL